MSCEFTEKVSALLDEELDEREAARLREHMNACADCREAERDFLILRGRLKSYASAERGGARQQRALRRILGSENVPVWKRRVSLPAPALALLLLMLLALGAWAAAARWRSGRTPPTEVAGEKRGVPRPAARPPAPSYSEYDLARFDHGGRALIYKVRREDGGRE